MEPFCISPRRTAENKSENGLTAQPILILCGDPSRQAADNHLRLCYAAETAIEAQGFRHAGFVRSIQVTDELMGRVGARAGTIPIVAFACTSAAPYNEAFKRVASHHGIEYWDDVADVVQKAERQGKMS